MCHVQRARTGKKDMTLGANQLATLFYAAGIAARGSSGDIDFYLFLWSLHNSDKLSFAVVDKPFILASVRIDGGSAKRERKQ